MQVNLGPKNLIIGAAILVAGYVGYRAFFGDIQTRDVPTLLRVHRTATSLKQAAIKRRLLSIYDHGLHYGPLFDALDHADPVTQALAVEVLAAKGKSEALPTFVALLVSASREAQVDAALARAMGACCKNDAVLDAVDRLVELTDDKAPHEVRVAAHDALVAILESGARVKFGESMRTRWREVWRDHRKRRQHDAKKGGKKK